MKKLIFAAILMSALSLSCALSLPANAANSKKIKLNKKAITLNIGKKTTLKVTSKSKVKWKSGNSKIAVVSKGVVRAKKAGKVKITAYSGKKSNGSYRKAVCTVTVKKKKKVNPEVVEIGRAHV